MNSLLGSACSRLQDIRVLSVSEAENSIRKNDIPWTLNLFHFSFVLTTDVFRVQ